MKTALTVLAAAAAALALSACGDDDRTATAETSVADAEVTPEMPEGAVTDAQLEAAANRAAAERIGATVQRLCPRWLVHRT